MKNQDIVITGASGFIGKNLVNYLIKNKIKFRSYSRKKTNFSIQVKNYKHIKIKKNSILIYLSQSNQNISSIKKEMSLIRDIVKLKWNYIIFFSSTRVYKKNKQINEFSDIDRSSNYNNLKLNSEKIVLKSQPSIILRITNIYGLYFNKNTLLHDILKNIYKKKDIKIKDTNEFIDYLNVSDLNDLILKLIRLKITGTYNVASGKPVKIENLIKLILNILKIKKKITSKTKSKFVNKNIFDISSIKKVARWSPKISIKKGLNEIFKKDLYFYR